jgi:hypothetical protein
MAQHSNVVNQPTESEQEAPAIISSALTKNWEPEKEFETRASKEDELAIWNKWIKPIVDLHYEGDVKYIYFSEPQKLSYDEFEKVWELSIAPFLCSIKLPGIKIPASKTQTELENLISSNIWEPKLFISEVLLPLRAGRGLQFVDSFLGCLISIIDGKDLPAFLAYIEHGQYRKITFELAPDSDFPKDRMPKEKEFAVWDHWIKPIIDKHFDGKIEYKYSEKPEEITPKDIEVIIRKMITPFVFEYEHGPFQTDDFLKEVVDRLRSGFSEYEGVDLKKWFQDFLSWVMYGGHLPAFLAYIDHERGGEFDSEDNRTMSPSSNLPEKDFYSILERYHADIGMFWESLSRKAKDRHSSIEVAQDFDLYDLAKEAYTDNSQHFVALKLADIDKREFYSRNAKPKRKIVGSILQKIVWRESPGVFAHHEIKNNTQWLFDQFNNHGLKKSP